MSGATLDEVVTWISELEDAGVFSRDEDGCIYSKRMIRDEQVRSARAAGGKLGGNPNLKKAAPKDNLQPNHRPTPSSSSSSSSSITTPLPPSPPDGGDDAGGDDEPKADAFELFWDAYPWKAGKQDAQKAWAKVEKNWAKLNKGTPDAIMLDTLLAAVAAQKEGDQWKRDGGQYIPRAATWLNGGRWLDEVRPYVAPPLKLPAGWWETPEGMKAAGAMLTPPLAPNKGEYPKEFAARIRAALGQIDAPDTTNVSAPPVAAPYVPPAPPPEIILTEEQREARRAEFKEQMAKLKQKGDLATAGIAAANASQPGDKVA
jgi:hypothetical protein